MPPSVFRKVNGRRFAEGKEKAFHGIDRSQMPQVFLEED